MEILNRARESLKAEEEKRKEMERLGHSLFKDITRLSPEDGSGFYHIFKAENAPDVVVRVFISDQIKSGKNSKNKEAIIHVDGGDYFTVKANGYSFIREESLWGNLKSCGLEEVQQYRELMDMIIKDSNSKQTEVK